MGSARLMREAFVIPAKAGIQGVRICSCEAATLACGKGEEEALDSRLRGNDGGTPA